MFSRARVNVWLADGQYDIAVWLQERRRTRWLGERLEDLQQLVVERPIRRALCLVLGHIPDRNQCDRPEHDYCAWCLKPMPNTWTRP